MKKRLHKYAIGTVIDGHTILDWHPKGAHWRTGACYQLRCRHCNLGTFYARPYAVRSGEAKGCGCLRYQPNPNKKCPAPSARFRWTSQISDAQIVAWLARGLSMRTISEIITSDLNLYPGTITRNMIIGRIHRLGLGAAKGSNVKNLHKAATSLPERGECFWPTSDPDKPDFVFCGLPSAPGRSYCAKHVRIAYIPERRRGEEIKDAAD